MVTGGATEEAVRSLIKLRRQKCGLRLEIQFLELPYHSTTSWVTAGVDRLPFLEASHPKSRCWQGRALPGGSRGESFPPASGAHGPSLGSLASSCSAVVSGSDVT